MKRVIIALIFAMVGGVSAMAEGTPYAYRIFKDVISGDCSTLKVSTLNGIEGAASYYYGTLVKVGGKIYADENALSEGVNAEIPWQLYSVNDRLMQTNELPLPKKTPITAEVTLFDLQYSPEWRSVATISKCNKNPKVTKVVNYQAFRLHSQGSFELYYEEEGTKIPMGWDANEAFLAAPSNILCSGVPVKVGSCVLQIVPNGSTQKLSMNDKPKDTIGGKYIELAAFQYVQGESNVKGNIKATIKFADGSKTTLKLTAKKHASSDGYKYAVVRAPMPAKLVSVKIVITEKGGSSGTWRIDGLSLSVYKKSKFVPVTRFGPLPLPVAG